MAENPLPVFIVTFNLLSTTRKLVDDILRMGGFPIIVDNHSTYPPLLEWYSEIEKRKDICLVKVPHNAGPHVVYHLFPIIARDVQDTAGLKIGYNDIYAITDCDLDISEIPDDGLIVLRKLAERERKGTRYHKKIGFGLRIDDLPVNAPHLINTRMWESQFFRKLEVIDGISCFTDVLIDTTFHIYIPTIPSANFYGPAIRTGGKYMARHIPWYWTKDTITEEGKYYLRHINTNHPISFSAQLKASLGM